jgi:hypothetical protein
MEFSSLFGSNTSDGGSGTLQTRGFPFNHLRVKEYTRCHDRTNAKQMKEWMVVHNIASRHALELHSSSPSHPDPSE